ncbi:MerR family transcriptional regulator [Streptosporangium oxazolinicum]|uniref:MerR family transcriptional regulator n=1 Tax=Streptosporangium oxazolinicum TaxID=909287 RepID=A0ABP8BHB0_9ACTN
MRSSELASLADVTVRTLRHYHRIGVLPEPGRDPSGYRRYTIHDLVRLLRVKRLAALGIPLHKVAGILDSEEDHHDLLSDLERELDAQIARLTKQKTMLGIIRKHRTLPDVPPELARFFAAFALSGVSPAMNRIDREQSVLLAHLVGEAGIEHLTGFYEHIAAPGTAEVVTGLARRFDRLDADAGPAVVDRLVDDFTERVGRIVVEFTGRNGGADLLDRESYGLFYQHMRDALNAAQRTALSRIMERLEALTGPPVTISNRSPDAPRET